MAQMVRQEGNDHEMTKIRPHIGRQVLDIVTAGMYDEPLMVYREYIQNAADSIDVAFRKGIIRTGEELIEIRVDGRSRQVIIQDNGAGVERKSIQRSLVGLGHSPKEGTDQRGFRGIGRLGGLAYCDKLTFETRSVGDTRVSLVIWDGTGLRGILTEQSASQSLDEILRKIVTTSDRRASNHDPAHFFRVLLENVRGFYSDELMSLKAIRNYMSQVAPLPYASEFSYGRSLDAYFSDIPGYRAYKLLINGKQMFRPYRNEIHLGKERSDSINAIERFSLSDPTGELLGRGWYAKTNFLAALPTAVAMRGIRIRQGNIEIGNEDFLASAFTERRFSVWHVGEIQLADHRIRPNARRDGFEQSRGYETFLEQMSILCKTLSALCRTYSRTRGARERICAVLANIDKRVKRVRVVVDDKHLSCLKEEIQTRLRRLETEMENAQVDEEVRNRLHRTSDYLDHINERVVMLSKSIDSRTLRYLDRRGLITKICNAILENYRTSGSAEELLQEIVRPYLRQ